MITQNDLTVRKRIKDALLRGDRLTTLTGGKMANTLDFRKYISLLRKEGLEIQDEWITAQSGKHFKEYFINIKHN